MGAGGIIINHKRNGEEQCFFFRGGGAGRTLSGSPGAGGGGGDMVLDASDISWVSSSERVEPGGGAECLVDCGSFRCGVGVVSLDRG